MNIPDDQTPAYAGKLLGLGRPVPSGTLVGVRTKHDPECSSLKVYPSEQACDCAPEPEGVPRPGLN